MDNLENADDEDIKIHVKVTMNQLLNKFDDSKSVDKISEAQANVDDVMMVMEDNVKKVLD